MYHAINALTSEEVYTGTLCWRESRKKFRVLVSTPEGRKEKHFNTHEQALAHQKKMSDALGKTLKRPKPSIDFKQYIAGMIDGDGCVTCYSREHSVDNPVVSIVQSQSMGIPEVLIQIRELYGGTIYSGNSYGKNLNQRRPHSLTIHGPPAMWLLLDMVDHIILKVEQVKTAIDIFSATTFEQGRELASKLASMKTPDYYINTNLDHLSTRCTIPYITGLFDAEGCVYFAKRSRCAHLEIAQTQCPRLLEGMRDTLGGFGGLQVVSHGHFKLSGTNAVWLMEQMLPFCIGKKFQVETMLKYSGKKRTVSDAEFEEVKVTLKRAKRC